MGVEWKEELISLLGEEEQRYIERIVSEEREATKERREKREVRERRREERKKSEKRQRGRNKKGQIFRTDRVDDAT